VLENFLSKFYEGEERESNL